MLYSRINLSKTNYKQIPNWSYINIPDVDKLTNIYISYCRYKKFKSVMPIFPCQFTDANTDVIGYYDQENLVAFSLIKKFDQHNAECVQFAWNYENPKLRLGIASLKHECALYKEKGFKYLYLGGADDYKAKFEGFEILEGI